MSDRTIAKLRGISRTAVKFHLANAKAKVGLRTRDRSIVEVPDLHNDAVLYSASPTSTRRNRSSSAAVSRCGA
jgi:hypothetical protein